MPPKKNAPHHSTPSPSGINSAPSFLAGKIPTYEDMKDDIERLVSMKAGKYKIPGYEREDIAQEIRMVAFRALKKFDPAKVHAGPFHFVARCIDNYLINLRRDNDAFLSKKKLAEADEKTLTRIDNKKRIFYPASLSDDEFADILNVEKTPECEIHESILILLPSGLHKSYWLVVENGEGAVPKEHFTQIKKVIVSLYG